MDMPCDERGSPHLGGVKITFRSLRPQQPDAGSPMSRLERAYLVLTLRRRQNAQLTIRTEGDHMEEADIS